MWRLFDFAIIDWLTANCIDWLTANYITEAKGIYTRLKAATQSWHVNLCAYMVGN